MFEKPDTRLFFLIISALCLFGAIVSAFFALASGIMLPQGSGSFLGLNIHIIYLFIFGGILWTIQQLRAIIDKEGQKTAPERNAKKS